MMIRVLGTAAQGDHRFRLNQDSDDGKYYLEMWTANVDPYEYRIIEIDPTEREDNGAVRSQD